MKNQITFWITYVTGEYYVDTHKLLICFNVLCGLVYYYTLPRWAVDEFWMQFYVGQVIQQMVHLGQVIHLLLRGVATSGVCIPELQLGLWTFLFVPTFFPCSLCLPPSSVHLSLSILAIPMCCCQQQQAPSLFQIKNFKRNSLCVVRLTLCYVRRIMIMTIFFVNFIRFLIFLYFSKTNYFKSDPIQFKYVCMWPLVYRQLYTTHMHNMCPYEFL